MPCCGRLGGSLLERVERAVAGDVEAQAVGDRRVEGAAAEVPDDVPATCVEAGGRALRQCREVDDASDQAGRPRDGATGLVRPQDVARACIERVELTAVR